MNLIAKLLPPGNVVVGLEASSKKRAFEQAGLLFENNHGIGRSTVFDSLFAREKLGSTGLVRASPFPTVGSRASRTPWVPSSAWQTRSPLMPPMAVR